MFLRRVEMRLISWLDLDLPLLLGGLFDRFFCIFPLKLVDFLAKIDPELRPAF